MTILVATETLLLVLLALLVVGLLRSHAEILRRLGPPDGEGTAPPAVQAPRLDGPRGKVQGGGAAGGGHRVPPLFRDAPDDTATADGTPGRSGRERAGRVDRALGAAGAGRGPPSLYPANGGDEPPST